MPMTDTASVHDPQGTQDKQGRRAESWGVEEEGVTMGMKGWEETAMRGGDKTGHGDTQLEDNTFSQAGCVLLASR